MHTSILPINRNSKFCIGLLICNMARTERDTHKESSSLISSFLWRNCSFLAILAKITYCTTCSFIKLMLNTVNSKKVGAIINFFARARRTQIYCLYWMRMLVIHWNIIESINRASLIFLIIHESPHCFASRASVTCSLRSKIKDSYLCNNFQSFILRTDEKEHNDSKRDDSLVVYLWASSTMIRLIVHVFIYRTKLSSKVESCKYAFILVALMPCYLDINHPNVLFDCLSIHMFPVDNTIHLVSSAEENKYFSNSGQIIELWRQ